MKNKIVAKNKYVKLVTVKLNNIKSLLGILNITEHDDTLHAKCLFKLRVLVFYAKIKMDRKGTYWLICGKNKKASGVIFLDEHKTFYTMHYCLDDSDSDSDLDLNSEAVDLSVTTIKIHKCMPVFITIDSKSNDIPWLTKLGFVYCYTVHGSVVYRK